MSSFLALVLVFVFSVRVYFFLLELVELFRLYLSASLCTLALATFVLPCWVIHDRGSIFLLVSRFKLLIDLCL